MERCGQGVVLCHSSYLDRGAPSLLRRTHGWRLGAGGADGKNGTACATADAAAASEAAPSLSCPGGYSDASRAHSGVATPGV